MSFQYDYPEMEAANGMLIAAASLQMILNLMEFVICFQALKRGKVKKMFAICPIFPWMTFLHGLKPPGNVCFSLASLLQQISCPWKRLMK
jgi:hypothetical protein